MPNACCDLSAGNQPLHTRYKKIEECLCFIHVTSSIETALRFVCSSGFGKATEEMTSFSAALEKTRKELVRGLHSPRKHTGRDTIVVTAQDTLSASCYGVFRRIKGGELIL